MDYEAQYQMTTEYVEQTFRENQDILEIYHVCVPFKVVTCASMFQTYWRPWDESMHAHWVRPMPVSYTHLFLTPIPDEQDPALLLPGYTVSTSKSFQPVSHSSISLH